MRRGWREVIMSDSSVKSVQRNMHAVCVLLGCSLLVTGLPVLAQTDPLPSWNEGSSKQALVRFVTDVTREGGPQFVPPPMRIAVFDNDGTLWAEQPFYFQVQFALDRVKALAPKHPEWKTKQPFKALLEGDRKTFAAGGEKALLEVIAVSHSGMTTEEFEGTVKDWM